MLNKLHDAFWKEHDVYQHRDFYSADKAAEYCDVRACLSVCQRASDCIYNLHQIFVHVARSSGGVAIRYLLPGLCMTTCLHILDNMEACRCRCSE